MNSTAFDMRLRPPHQVSCEAAPARNAGAGCTTIPTSGSGREVFPYLPTFSVMDRYADVRRQLRQPHGPGLIGDVDTIIAATALVHDLTMVTTDIDFQCVPNLKVLLLDRHTLQPVAR